MLSKVSTTLGLSSASMAASESEFSISSSSKSPSPGGGSAPSPSSPLARSGAPLNGVAPVGAAGLDALGDRNLALEREQLHRAHFAQIHAHRIVRALGRLLGFGPGWHRAL